MNPDFEVEAKEESRTGKVQEKDSEIKKIVEKADKERLMDVPLIEFKDVTKRFGPRTILEGVNLQIYEEQVTTIIGLSGSGKSVLLKHIVGLLKPDEGTILFRGKPLHQMEKKEMDACLGQMSYMFQGNALFDSMTVYENVAMRTHDLPAKYSSKRACASSPNKMWHASMRPGAWRMVSRRAIRAILLRRRRKSSSLVTISCWAA